MARLFITKGFPGCGKSTFVEEFINTQQHRGLRRVNKDTLRWMTNNKQYTASDNDTIHDLSVACTRILLANGYDVIVDECNTESKMVQEFKELAQLYSADFIIIDFTNISIETCIKRDSNRAVHQRVGAEVIRKKAEELQEAR